MDPWSAIAKAVVYPLARAIADAYFDARARYDYGIEEMRDDDDVRRARNLGAAIKRMQPIPATGNDSRPVDPAPSSGGIDSNNLGPSP